jgi:hypothetical protein
VAGDHGAARRGRVVAGQHADRGGLAGTVRAEEADHLAASDFERDAVDGQERAVALRELGDGRSCGERVSAVEPVE